ncbi:hypothetical protein ATANTOWER_022158 [Ataeniobius toweri]|uniref:Uncharacterized protein n=1 Tax=Ataeniobius toweri TaxID=208326 RepID=A0ABU7BZZ1_9TELE|nr:hypothetical protein [Ataeniobius toweri]
MLRNHGLYQIRILSLCKCLQFDFQLICKLQSGPQAQQPGQKSVLAVSLKQEFHGKNTLQNPPDSYQYQGFKKPNHQQIKSSLDSPEVSQKGQAGVCKLPPTLKHSYEAPHLLAWGEVLLD